MTHIRNQATLDELLDEALEETFPASDPVALSLYSPKRARPIGARRPGLLLLGCVLGAVIALLCLLGSRSDEDVSRRPPP